MGNLWRNSRKNLHPFDINYRSERRRHNLDLHRDAIRSTTSMLKIAAVFSHVLTISTMLIRDVSGCELSITSFLPEPKCTSVDVVWIR